MTHPVANPEPEDFTADGVPYDMVTKGRDLYILEANSGALDRVSTRTGSISRVIDISATQGHIVPTALDRQGKNFYVGNLGTFPITPGTENIYRISPNGKLKAVASGLTAILGVAFDDDQRMYVLETSTTGPFPNPGAGQIVRQSRSGSWETVVSGLTYPSAMIFGPDDALYVSTNGYNNPAAGEGQVVRVDVDHHH